MSDIQSTTILACVKTRFEAIHYWKNAPTGNPVNSFLRFPHRHLFHVEVKVTVSHDDRDVEYFELVQKVQEYIHKEYEKKDLENTSCEMIARSLLIVFNALFVSVYEDGENGCEIFKNQINEN